MSGALTVAVLALVVAVTSLTWQIAMFFLSGSRVKVELVVGSRSMDSGHLTLGRVPESDGGWSTRVKERGEQPLVGVRVRNVGRGSTTVMGWRLADRDGFSIIPTAPDIIGKALPHRLEGGEAQAWAMEEVVAWGNLMDAARQAQAVGFPGFFRAAVELGNGRVRKSKNRMLISD